MSDPLDQQVEAVWEAVAPLVRFASPECSHAVIKGAIREALRPLALEDFGLIRGEKVKFVRPGAKQMKYGVALGVNPDRSLQIYDIDRGYERAVTWDRVSKEVTGPRGGTSWRPLAKPTKETK